MIQKGEKVKRQEFSGQYSHVVNSGYSHFFGHHLSTVASLLCTEMVNFGKLKISYSVFPYFLDIKFFWSMY